MILCPCDVSFSNGSAMYHSYNWRSWPKPDPKPVELHSEPLIAFQRLSPMSPSTFLIHLLRTHTLFQQETKVSLTGEPPCCDPSVLKLYIVPVAPNERSQKSMLCPMGQDLKFRMLDWYFLMTYYKDDYQSLSVNCLNIMIFFS